jgi:predicted transcriptional regulator
MSHGEKELKRTRYDTYADLIRVISHRGFCSLSRAARSANLPVDRAKVTIQYLCDRGVLVEKEENNQKGYKTTARGFTYLELYKQIRTMVGAPEPTTFGVF